MIHFLKDVISTLESLHCEFVCCKFLTTTGGVGAKPPPYILIPV